MPQCGAQADSPDVNITSAEVHGPFQTMDEVYDYLQKEESPDTDTINQEGEPDYEYGSDWVICRMLNRVRQVPTMQITMQVMEVAKIPEQFRYGVTRKVGV
jgi:hypothetical protein